MRAILATVILLTSVTSVPLGTANFNSCTATEADPECTFHCHAFGPPLPSEFHELFIIVNADKGEPAAGEASCDGTAVACAGLTECSDSRLTVRPGSATCTLLAGTSATCGDRSAIVGP